MRLVLTRPRIDAERQAERIKALGHYPLIYPLMEISYPELSPLHLEGIQALIVSSRNALRGLLRNGSYKIALKLPLYCVGEGTAEFARQSGFTHIITGAGTARHLLPLILGTARSDAGALLYLTGYQVAYDLETPLRQAGFSVPRLIVYEAQAVGEEKLGEFLWDIRIGVNGIVLMSPRTAAIFASLIRRFELEHAVRRATCYCYSDAIAQELSGIEGLTIAVSSHPTEDDLMQLIGPASCHSAVQTDFRSVLGKH